MSSSALAVCVRTRGASSVAEKRRRLRKVRTVAPRCERFDAGSRGTNQAIMWKAHRVPHDFDLYQLALRSEIAELMEPSVELPTAHAKGRTRAGAGRE